MKHYIEKNTKISSMNGLKNKLCVTNTFSAMHQSSKLFQGRQFVSHRLKKLFYNCN